MHYAILNPMEFPSSYFSWHIQSMWSLGCNTLCIIIILFSFGPFSPLVHCKKSPEYLSKESTQVLILLMRFLLQSLVWSFLVFLKYSFHMFFFQIRKSNGVRFLYARILVIFLSRRVQIHSWFRISNPSADSLFPLFIISIAFEYSVCIFL